MTRKQRLDVAAYLLDRADQYDTDSPCWVGLVDAARAVARGEVEEAIAHGELAEPELRLRVRRMSKMDKAPAVDPKLGVET